MEGLFGLSSEDVSVDFAFLRDFVSLSAGFALGKARELSFHSVWGRSSVGRAPQWHCGGQAAKNLVFPAFFRFVFVVSA